jgi:Domain of unknown function (DUF3850)
MKHHDLKIWPEYFQSVKYNSKPFEVRKDDRNFEVGDVLHLHEYDPQDDSYTNDVCHRKITYKLSGGSFGIEDGYCVLGLTNIKNY